MNVVPLTLTISLGLVFIFIVFFLCEHARGRVSSAERDSLLPLAEETPRPAPTPRHESGCGCAGGQRPPCPGCVKPRDHV